jgi:hypothetical protein
MKMSTEIAIDEKEDLACWSAFAKPALEQAALGMISFR